jgi:dethiobiotin synthetase
VLLCALGGPISDIDAISPWRFAAPLSPDMAAAREGRTLDFEAIVEFSRQCSSERRSRADRRRRRNHGAAR